MLLRDCPYPAGSRLTHERIEQRIRHLFEAGEDAASTQKMRRGRVEAGDEVVKALLVAVVWGTGGGFE